MLMQPWVFSLDILLFQPIKKAGFIPAFFMYNKVLFTIILF